MSHAFGAGRLGAWLYILKCADGSFYAGTARSDLEKRIVEHQSGSLGGYTAKRRPVMLAYAQHFDRITDAITAERQVKGWPRTKKKALIAGDFARLRAAAKRKGPFKTCFAAVSSSFETRASPAPQDEDE